LLAATELGLPGMVAWLAILFAGFKTVYGSSRLAIIENAEIVQIWGLALLSMLIGLGVGIFFLSFTYHYIFWIYLGMVAAFSGAVARRYPLFRVRVTSKEVGLLTLGGLLLLGLIFVYASAKLRSA
jgi:hypothetical protein